MNFIGNHALFSLLGDTVYIPLARGFSFSVSLVNWLKYAAEIPFADEQLSTIVGDLAFTSLENIANWINN